MGYIHGKNGYAKVQGERFALKSWRGSAKSAAVATTDSESGGWETYLPGGGIKGFEGSISANFNVGKDPHMAPLNFWAIDGLIDLELIADDGFRYVMQAFVTNVDVTLDTADENTVSVEIAFRSSGPVTITRA